jgi:hypothetical protein
MVAGLRTEILLNIIIRAFAAAMGRLLTSVPATLRLFRRLSYYLECVATLTAQLISTEKPCKLADFF